MTNKEKWLSVMGDLATKDPQALRLIAFLLASSEEADAEVRRMMLCACLGVTDVELERCFDVLVENGIAESSWWN